MLKKLLILLVLPFLLVGCAKKNVEEITFSSWGSVTEVAIINKVIDDFEQENPNVKINFIHVPQNYYQKLHLLFAASQEPDVIFINNLYLPVYANKLEDLSSIIKKSDFYPQSLEAMSYEGKILAFPRDISNLVFFYNKNLVKIPSAWQFDDFIPTLDSARGEFKTSFERDIYWAEPYIMTLGEAEGIEFYKKLEGKYAPNPSQVGSSTLAQMFLDGKIALYLSGRWMYPKITKSADFPVGIVRFPGIVPADASGWAIAKNSKHKKEALRFVEYLASSRSIDYFTQTGLIVPARIDSAKKMKDGEVFLEAISNSRVMKIDKNYRKNRDKINKELFN